LLHKKLQNSTPGICDFGSLYSNRIRTKGADSESRFQYIDPAFIFFSVIIICRYEYGLDSELIFFQNF